VGSTFKRPVVEHFHKFVDQGNCCQIQVMGDRGKRLRGKIQVREIFKGESWLAGWFFHCTFTASKSQW
jgi:hypothetical protein